MPTFTHAHTHSHTCSLSQAPHSPICAHTHSHTCVLSQAPHSPTPINSMLTCAHTLSHLLKYLFYHIPPYGHFSQTITLTQPFPSGDHHWSGVPFLSSSWIFPHAAHSHVLCFYHGSRPSTMLATLPSPMLLHFSLQITAFLLFPLILFSYSTVASRRQSVSPPEHSASRPSVKDNNLQIFRATRPELLTLSPYHTVHTLLL